uniref:Uncharacterized protein LOC111129583 n=1 Tax=Crassostrea virginica TaxID=6565 RepID=A0A8B8DV32_CRAVI|nr:uncharacterized protein LOC111129583 [Crassostrea virginica]
MSQSQIGTIHGLNIQDNHDCPVPIKQLKILKARYAGIQDFPQLHAHYFDPRSVDQRQNHSEKEISEIAISLREVSPNIQALDILEEEKPVKEKPGPCDQLCSKCISFTIPNILKSVTCTSSNSNDSVNDSFTLSSDNIAHIESCTVEQSDNKTWHELRKGRLTASNFYRVCKAVDANNCPLSLSKTILGDYGEINAPSLVWGKKKEMAALHESLSSISCKTFFVKKGFTNTP